ncbi:MAG: protein serine phosphatase [Planctomycetaceae bacterium]|nr:protein serine phosphatase [Planctomycetaceae bacterium]
MAVLECLTGGSDTTYREITGERVVFGRHPSCEVVIDKAAVSRYHARILQSHGRFYIEDLRSRNGTQVNQSDIEGRQLLDDGDEIRVCDFSFRFHESMPSGKTRDSTIDRKADQSWATNIGRETRPVVVEDPDDSTSERSSIISTLEAGTSSNLRLSVKPEAKLRSILEVSRSLGRVLGFDEVLSTILDGLFKIFSQAEEGFILLKEDDTGELSVHASKSVRETTDELVPVCKTIVNRVVETAESILSANASEDPRFQASDSLANYKIQSVICAPLIGKAENMMGVIQISTADLKMQFTQDDLDLLASVASQASLAIENSTLHMAVMKQRDLERDLDFATQVQLGFLPDVRPKFTCYTFFDHYEAAQRVGGDYFDYITLPDNRVAVAIADVAGKGVPAALLMARLYSSARYHLLTQPTVAGALSGLNSEIASSGLGRRFITCVLAVVDSEKHELTLANAGHLPPLRRTADGNVVPIGQKDSGMPLGIVPTQTFDETKYLIDPGDTWLFFTDGVTEAKRGDNEFYGGQRLIDYVASGPAEANKLVKGVIADVENFCEGTPQADDTCLVCFRRDA